MPGAFLASTAFVEAAEVQAEALAFPARRCFVPHPIQDRTDEEMMGLAEAAWEEILGNLQAPE